MSGSRSLSRKHMSMRRNLRAYTARTPAIVGWRTGPSENGAMLDILMLAIGLGCFALFALYGIAGERL